MKIKRKAYISLEVVFLLTIMVISGMYVTIKLFNKGHDVSGQEAEAFSKVNHTVNNAINVGSSGGGGSGGGGGGSTPSEPTGVIDTIYWGIDASGKLIISDVQVAGTVENGSFAGTDTFDPDLLPPWTASTYSGNITSIEVVRNNRKVAPASTAFWFAYLENVTSINVSNLNTSNVTDMTAMFYDCGLSATALTIEGLETWDTSNVTCMTNMFSRFGANSITELDLSNWDASNVTVMFAMFAGMNSLQTIKTPKNIPSTVDIRFITEADLWDITDNDKVYTAGTFPVGNGNMSHTLSFVGPGGINNMIYWDLTDGSLIIGSDPSIASCSNIQIYPAWAPPEVCGKFSKDVVFNIYDGVTSAPWGEYADMIETVAVEDVTAPLNTDYWFAGLRNVTEVYASKMDARNVTSMKEMFNGMSLLETIETPVNIPNSVDVRNITSYDSWDITDNNKKYTAGTFPVGNGNISHTLSFIDPDSISVTIYWGIDAYSTLIISDKQVTTATGGRSGSFSRRVVFDNESDAPWYSYRNDISSIQIEKTGVGVTPVSTAYWFANLQNVTFVEVSNLNTRYVTKMQSMFADCGYAASRFQIVGLENWDTSNVVNMEGMFRSAGYSATSFDIGNISNWDTSKVTTTMSMFNSAGVNAITELDLSGWDGRSLGSISSMFNGINTLKVIKTPKNIPSNATIARTISKNFDGSDGWTYVPGTFPRGNTESVTLTSNE